MRRVFYISSVLDETTFFSWTGLSLIGTAEKVVPQEVVPVKNGDGLDSMGAKYEYGMKVLQGRFPDIDDSDMVVFLHEDLKFDRKDVEARVCKAFDEHSDLGVLGVYGTETWAGGGWWTYDRKNKASGRIIQHLPNGQIVLMQDRPTDWNDKLVAVDGCFLASKWGTISKLGWRGVVSGWHQYDNDLCFRLLLETNLTVAVSDVMIEHNSEGPVGPEWKASADKLLSWMASKGISVPASVENFKKRG